MTQGETLFYLREIHQYWRTSNISSDKLVELEAAKLIERSTDPFPAVRLTRDGVRWKASGRPQNSTSSIRLNRKRDNSRKHSGSKFATVPRPLQ
jgi:hypothetical protein